jgi:hypothetical protein
MVPAWKKGKVLRIVEPIMEANLLNVSHVH